MVNQETPVGLEDRLSHTRSNANSETKPKESLLKYVAAFTIPFALMGYMAFHFSPYNSTNLAKTKTSVAKVEPAKKSSKPQKSKMETKLGGLEKHIEGKTALTASAPAQVKQTNRANIATKTQNSNYVPQSPPQISLQHAAHFDYPKDGIYVSLSIYKDPANAQKQLAVISKLESKKNLGAHTHTYLYGVSNQDPKKQIIANLAGPFRSAEDAKEYAQKLLREIDFLNTTDSENLGIIKIQRYSQINKTNNQTNAQGLAQSTERISTTWLKIIQECPDPETTDDSNWLKKRLAQKGHNLDAILQTIIGTVRAHNKANKKTNKRVDPNFVTTITYVESSFDPTTVAYVIDPKTGERKKAGQGLGQITAETAIDLIYREPELQTYFKQKGLEDSFFSTLKVYKTNYGSQNPKKRALGEQAHRSLIAQINPFMLREDVSAKLEVTILGNLSCEYGGDQITIAAAYNGGPGCTKINERGIPLWEDTRYPGYQQTRDYVKKADKNHKLIMAGKHFIPRIRF